MEHRAARHDESPAALAAAGRPIPTLSQWGMILLSSLLALGSIVMLRRRRG